MCNALGQCCCVDAFRWDESTTATEVKLGMTENIHQEDSKGAGSRVRP